MARIPELLFRNVVEVFAGKIGARRQNSSIEFFLSESLFYSWTNISSYGRRSANSADHTHIRDVEHLRPNFAVRRRASQVDGNLPLRREQSRQQVMEKEKKGTVKTRNGQDAGGRTDRQTNTLYRKVSVRQRIWGTTLYVHYAARQWGAFAALDLCPLPLGTKWDQALRKINPSIFAQSTVFRKNEFWLWWWKCCQDILTRAKAGVGASSVARTIPRHWGKQRLRYRVGLVFYYHNSSGPIRREWATCCEAVRSVEIETEFLARSHRVQIKRIPDSRIVQKAVFLSIFFSNAVSQCIRNTWCDHSWCLRFAPSRPSQYVSRYFFQCRALSWVSAIIQNIKVRSLPCTLCPVQ